MRKIQQDLFSMQDLEYRSFSAKLIPSIDPQRIIGVRTPALRTYAKSLFASAEAELFLQELPHCYHEENNLHAFLLEQRKDYHQLIEGLENFLPVVDNWATCDSISPKIFRRHLDELKQQCRLWLDSQHTYVVRFAIRMLMNHFLDSKFDPAFPEWVSSVKSEEYYIKMMVAWYFATALAKQWDKTLPYFITPHLDSWSHNKAIQKALESYRITQKQKQLLRTLKVR